MPPRPTDRSDGYQAGDVLKNPHNGHTCTVIRAHDETSAFLSWNGWPDTWHQDKVPQSTDWLELVRRGEG